MLGRGPTSSHFAPLIGKSTVAISACQGKTLRFFKEIRYPRVWRSYSAGGAPPPRRMVENRGLAGLVVLHGLGQPGLDLSDPGLRQRVGRQELGLSRPPSEAIRT